jgi:hypothetical protein
MHEQYSIRRHLSGQIEVAADAQYFNGFTAGLRDSRRMTGRDPDSGVVVHPEQTVCWLGILGYMILLDQLGKCFRPKGAKPRSRNGFKSVLRDFAGLNDADITALWALRCTLAHDYSLVAEDAKSGYLTYHFRLIGGNAPPIVTHPKTPWHGRLGVDYDDDATTINVELFANLVETIVQLIRERNEDGEIEICLRGGWHELLNRYHVRFARQ